MQPYRVNSLLPKGKCRSLGTARLKQSPNPPGICAQCLQLAMSRSGLQRSRAVPPLHPCTPVLLQPCSLHPISCSTQPCLWLWWPHSTPVAALLDGCPLVLGTSRTLESPLHLTLHYYRFTQWPLWAHSAQLSCSLHTVASLGTQYPPSAVLHGSQSCIFADHAQDTVKFCCTLCCSPAPLDHNFCVLTPRRHFPRQMLLRNKDSVRLDFP